MDVEIKINTDEGYKSEVIHIDDDIYKIFENFAKEKNCSVDDVIKFVMMNELKSYV